MFSIDTFISSVARNGTQKTNKFLARFPTPRGLRELNSAKDTARFLELWCESAQIPGVALMTSDVRRYGYGAIEKKPYTEQHNDSSFQFIADGKMAIWTHFQQWMKLIINYDMRAGIMGKTGVDRGALQLPYEIQYKDDYAVDVEIILFSDEGKERQKIILRDAFPIYVGDIQLNWSDQNQYARIPVSMTMFDWYNETVNVRGGREEHVLPKIVDGYTRPANGRPTE